MLIKTKLYSDARVSEREELQSQIDQAADRFKIQFGELRRGIAALSIVPHASPQRFVV
jgi:hypothetical protein